MIGDQVEMVPSSVAKRNCAGVPRTRKSCAMGLNTMPVGAEGTSLPETEGMPTAKGISGLPEESNILALLRLLSAIQKDCPGWNATPQGLSRKGSVCAAFPALSETRLVCWNPLLVDFVPGALPPPQAGIDKKPAKAAQKTNLCHR